MKNNFSELKKFLKEKRKKDPFLKIVATNGCFDVLHAGHLKNLKIAKSYGDILVVGINSDKSVRKLKGPSRPINKENDRKKLLEELRCVDFVCVFENLTCEDFLKATKPDIYVKGGDYSINSLNEKEKKMLLLNKTEIKFVEFEKGLSSTNILNKI